MRRLAALCALVCFALPACARQTAAPGFYRNAHDPTVYKLDAQHRYCIVTSMVMMNAYGGLSQVNVTSDPAASFTRGHTELDPPACGWPDGDYRKTGAQAVFRVSGDTICLAGSRQNRARVQVVDAATDLAAHKRFLGNCR